MPLYLFETVPDGRQMELQMKMDEVSDYGEEVFVAYFPPVDGGPVYCVPYDDDARIDELLDQGYYFIDAKLKRVFGKRPSSFRIDMRGITA